MNNKNNIIKVALILASGIEYSLWPISNDKRPKQFSYFLGEGSLLQNTFDRLLKLYTLDEIFVTTASGYENFVIEQLPDLKRQNLIIEPFMNGSLSALMLANSIINKRLGDDTIITVFPSDHVIKNINNFISNIETAVNIVNENHNFLSIGIKPEKPLEKLGYIQIKIDNQNLNKKSDKIHSINTQEYFNQNNIYNILTFAEKPDLLSAERFIKTNEFYWNTGIYTVCSSTLLNLYRLIYTNEYNLFTSILEFVDKRNFDLQVNLLYRRLKPSSIENGLLEKINLVDTISFKLLIGEFDWVDLDNWEEVYLESKKDSKGNSIEGHITIYNSNNNLVRSKGLEIAILGAENLIVIENEGKLLIANRNSVNEVKELNKELKRKF